MSYNARLTPDEYWYLRDLREMDDAHSGMLAPSKNVAYPDIALRRIRARGLVRVENGDDVLFSGWGGVKFLTTKGLRALQREESRRGEASGG